MRYQTFIWDVGGTLFDTLKTSVKAFSKVLAEFHLEVEESKIYEQMKKTSTGEAAEFFVGKEKVERFLQRYHEVEAPMQKNPELFPDTEETLRTIVACGGENYIISNRDLQVVDFLEEKQLIRYFSYVITKSDGFPRKPSPVSVEYLFEHFDVEAGKAIMIGDRELDILAGKNAGIATALYSTDGLIQVKEADYTIHHLSEVLSL